MDKDQNENETEGIETISEEFVLSKMGFQQQSVDLSAVDSESLEIIRRERERRIIAHALPDLTDGCIE
jgi:hypothetical protein